MIFKYPQVFFLIFLLPLYIYQIIKISKKNNPIPFPTSIFFEKIKYSNYKIVLLKLVMPLRVLILILLIISAARPQIIKEKIEVSIKGVDIILALDTSESMLAKDLSPNRLEVAKDVISKFIKKQKENRIGLIVFSGKSFTLSPLTFDYDLVLELLHDIDVETVKVNGTAIGDAIANSLYRFKYNDISRNKVIVLLTDGENNSGSISPEKATALSKNKGVKIYTIGVGGLKPAYIPVIDPITGKEIHSQNQLVSQLNESSLKAIAKATQGEYFRAKDSKTLEDIYNKINMIEKGELEKKKLKIFSELYLYFLIPAFILLLLNFISSRTILKVTRI